MGKTIKKGHDAPWLATRVNHDLWNDKIVGAKHLSKPGKTGVGIKKIYGDGIRRNSLKNGHLFVFKLPDWQNGEDYLLRSLDMEFSVL